VLVFIAAQEMSVLTCCRFMTEPTTNGLKGSFIALETNDLRACYLMVIPTR
jgi:hypothetical protein